MITRHLFQIAFSSQWGRQMRFITGPRQVGKTTLAKKKLRETGCNNLYYLWDLRNVRQQYKENELFFTKDALLLKEKQKWICFDEIHKMPRWKNILKATFDTTGEKFHFIVTGSAKLNIVKRAGDSLAGRYFTFHLMPVSLSEIELKAQNNFILSESAHAFIEKCLDSTPVSQNALNQLIQYSGFPEPLLRNTRAFYRKWSNDYVENVIREDIGVLTRIIDREKVYDLYNMLPEMVGSPISEASLASSLEVSSVTVKNYLRRLEDFYLVFSVRPYSKKIKRSLLKARKYYLYDWSRIKDPGARFENYVACEIMFRLRLWSDATGEDFRLDYIRNKQKQETDFLVVRNGTPWLLLEAKLSDRSIEKHHFETASALNNIPLVYVCFEPKIASMQSDNTFRISANRLFGFV